MDNILIQTENMNYCNSNSNSNDTSNDTCNDNNKFFNISSIKWLSNKKKLKNGTYEYFCIFKKNKYQCKTGRMIYTSKHKEYQNSIYSKYCSRHQYKDRRKKPI